MPSQTELRSQITAKIIDAIETKNLLPWRCPWVRGKVSGRHRNVQGRAYSGINPLILELHACIHGFASRTWGTYNQWTSLGLQVKKRPDNVKAGAWGASVVLFRPVKKTKIDKESGEEVQDSFLVAKQFSVFNSDQVSGLGIEKYQDQQATETPGFDVDYGPAEELLKATGAIIIRTGNQAFYRQPTPDNSWPNHEDGDWIVLPPKETFLSSGAYYETAFHELAHWSEVRLLGSDRSENEEYAYGELVAEITSTVVAQELGVPQGEPLENHAAYLKSWLKGMKGDASFLFHASTQASKVTNFLLSFLPSEKSTEESNAEEAVGAV